MPGDRDVVFKRVLFDAPLYLGPIGIAPLCVSREDRAKGRAVISRRTPPFFAASRK